MVQKSHMWEWLHVALHLDMIQSAHRCFVITYAMLHELHMTYAQVHMQG